MSNPAKEIRRPQAAIGAGGNDHATGSVQRRPGKAAVHIENAAQRPPSSDLLQPIVFTAEDGRGPDTKCFEHVSYVVVRTPPGQLRRVLVRVFVVGLRRIVHALGPAVLALELERMRKLMANVGQQRVEVGVGVIRVPVSAGHG